MNSNLTVRPYKPTFKANFADKFLDAADSYYSKNPKGYRAFCENLRKFNEFKNTDDITISYKVIYQKGKKLYILLAEKLGDNKPVILSSKDQFRKLLEKFSHITKFEFDIKTARFNK